MSTSVEEIKSWFDRGVGTSDSHMIVMMDSYDYSDYPVYTPQGSDPKLFIPTNGDRVMECYSFAVPWEVQAAERRANHWEF